jgi:hypothetical protein
VTAEVLVFPAKHVGPAAEGDWTPDGNQPTQLTAHSADTEGDLYGPPGHIDAWVCSPCDENPEVNPDGKFCFYVTREGVHCWTCHAVQYFT